jgi:heat shock protein HspQ
MIDKAQIPHLLALLDDDSAVVRKSVTDAFSSFEEDLDGLLASAGASSEQIVAVQRLVTGTSTVPNFQIGQLVRHKRYGYRGVVVAVDEACDAEDEWYEANQTQPDRDQPWYHVLADGSDEVYYPAESSLEEDESDDAVDNPHVTEFFGEFLDGAYVRNDRPWGEEK